MNIPDLSTVQWILVGLLVAAQLTLLIAGLVSVLRTPAERLTAPKVVWALICFVQFIGPIAYFVAGRKPAPASEPAQMPPAQRPATSRVVDELYRNQP